MQLYSNIHTFIFRVLLACILFLGNPCFPILAQNACDNTLSDYISLPHFISNAVKPNVLLVLDNSGSMNEFAYHEVEGSINEWKVLSFTGYQPGKEYYGLFNSNKMYSYDRVNHYFFEDGDTVDDPKTSIYERSTGSDKSVKKWSGNWLNWWCMRRIDVAKKVLTGGKIAPDKKNVVLEGMPTERDFYRFFNDHTTADDPYGVLTGEHEKHVYYTPFHRGIASYWFNVDRGKHLTTGATGAFVPMFRTVAAQFINQGALTGQTKVSLKFKEGTLSFNETDLANNPVFAGVDVGEIKYAQYPFSGFVFAVKVEDAGKNPVSGIIQKMIHRVRFGYMRFNNGMGPGEGYPYNEIGEVWDIDDNGKVDQISYLADGGKVENFIGDIDLVTDPRGAKVSSIIHNINQQRIEMNTPIGEVLWEAMGYFRQIQPAFLPGYDSGTPSKDRVNYQVSPTWDPYYFNNLNGKGSGGFVPCTKSYIILVSDGEANNDDGIPTGTYPSGAKADVDLKGDGYIDDIAYNMHTKDLRRDLPQDQLSTLYTVFTFEDSPIAKAQMMRAARAGGYEEMDGRPGPCGTVAEDPSGFVGCLEWDKDKDNVPDTYFEAQDGKEMEEKIMMALSDIIGKSSSGSSASVNSASRNGEGAVYQAVFNPESEVELGSGRRVSWYGTINSLFIDEYGYLREDTNRNQRLDLSEDLIIEFEKSANQYNLFSFDPVKEEKKFEKKTPIDSVRYIWDASEWLKSPALNVDIQRVFKSTLKQRYIVTNAIDTKKKVSLSNVSSNELMPFTADFANDALNDNYFFLNPYQTGVTLENDMIAEAKNIISFVRGKEGLIQPGTSIPYRNRSLDKDGDNVVDTVYRIGDIVHSAPIRVGAPAESYDLMYKDESYREYRKRWLNRRIVVYAGANDGMFHAFNGGFVMRDQNGKISFSKKSKAEDTDFDLGAELWAYVPNATLPHLKWLKESYYQSGHVYYVDLPPSVFDAKVFVPDSDHPKGWGTILVGGLRLGGKPIGVNTQPSKTGNCDLHFGSVFFAFDITNPEKEPKLMWTFSDPDLGFTTAKPSIVRVGGSWYFVIGSGPTDYDAVKKDGTGQMVAYGGSNQKASLFVIDPLTGSKIKTFHLENDAFVLDPIVVDLDLKKTVTNGNVVWDSDVIYVAVDGNGINSGRMTRIVTHSKENPEFWEEKPLFNPNTLQSGDQHISTPPNVTIDTEGRIWVYFGTGRLYGNTDKADPYYSIQNAFYGIKEPVDEKGELLWNLVTKTELRNVSDVNIIDEPGETQNIFLASRLACRTCSPVISDQDHDGSVTLFDLVRDMENHSGWYFNFDLAGERAITPSIVFGDMVFFTSYLPDKDICATTGESYLYSVYYKTGTAFATGVLKASQNNDTGIDPYTNEVVKKISMGEGLAWSPRFQRSKHGLKALVQTSIGSIEGFKPEAPGFMKNKKTSWWPVKKDGSGEDSVSP